MTHMRWTMAAVTLAFLLATFAAAADKEDDPTAERVKVLKDNLEQWSLNLRYHGNQDKPFYKLILYTGDRDIQSEPFAPAVKVTKEEAAQVIEALAKDGFLRRSFDLTNKRLAAPQGPCYTLNVSVGKISLYENLGWDLKMLRRLDALKKALPDNAAKPMGLLIGRLNGYRLQWEKEEKP